MSQNLAAVRFDDTQWTTLDQAMTALVHTCAPVLVALNGPAQRRRLVKMGDGSEAFCRKAHDVLSENAPCWRAAWTWRKWAAAWPTTTHSTPAWCA